MQQPLTVLTPRAARPIGRMRPLLLVSAVALALTSVGTAAFSLALFTSSVNVTANTFTTGTIVISASPSTALVTFSNMLPGDSITAPLTVSNAGTGQLRYAMTSTSTNTDSKSLRDQLTLVVKTQDTDTSACGNFNGTTLSTGPISGAAVGDVTSGAQTGDRTLDSLTNEILCFRATLPLSTGNAFQNATTTTTFTFSAEQTANN